MSKVIFADGTEQECSFFGLSSNGHLFIILNNIDFLGAAIIFGDAEKTREITYTPESGESVSLTNYTKFEYLVNEKDGSVRASLRQPYISEVETNGTTD